MLLEVTVSYPPTALRLLVGSFVRANEVMLCLLPFDSGIARNRLLHPTTCRPHKDRVTSPSALAKNTTNEGFFFALSLLC